MASMVGLSVVDAASALYETVPGAYTQALRNPLMGFTTRGVYNHEWATTAHTYIRWNELENVESDGLDKILLVSNQKWTGVETRNVKVIPRVYLHWSGTDRYWPSDMTESDYTSDQFKTRLTRLISRLGTAWNNDPRVAFIELGIFGQWGEHHSPDPTAELQTLAANAFAAAFPNKLVSVRHCWSQFTSQPFGEYWDSWAHYDQMRPHGKPIADINASAHRYLTNYIGGEVAYDWGSSDIQPGATPTASVSLPVHRDFIINTIRWLHCTQLRWIDDYDTTNAAARTGAELIQRAFGYRFVLERVAFTPQVTNGALEVEFDVVNQGSAPFYYDWPVEVSLLDMTNHSVVWSDTFATADIRKWLPGDGWTDPDWIATTNWPKFYASSQWSSQTPGWATAPVSVRERGTFQVQAAPGRYILALAILDPAGRLPSVRFATSNYFTGGRHPVGIVAVGSGTGGALPPTVVFDEPRLDRTLHYSKDFVPTSTQSPKAALSGANSRSAQGVAGGSNVVTPLGRVVGGTGQNATPGMAPGVYLIQAQGHASMKAVARP